MSAADKLGGAPVLLHRALASQVEGRLQRSHWYNGVEPAF